MQVFMGFRLIRHERMKIRKTAFIHRRIQELCRLSDQADHIQTKSVDSRFCPETQHFFQGLSHLRVSPIQIRLCRAEKSKIILPAALVIVPCGSSELTAPVVWHVTPDVPVTLLSQSGRTAFLKPRMIRRGMIQHHIQNDPYSPFVSILQQQTEVIHGSVFRVDRRVIGNIISVVDSGTRKKRSDPNRVCTKHFDIRQFLSYPFKVTDAVTIAVKEAADVDLIDNRVFPLHLAHARSHR